MQWEWIARDRPLVPCALIATGNVAVPLARRLLLMDETSLNQLEGVAGHRFLAVLGEEQNLPWVAGGVYLGIDPDVPGYFLPTTHCTTLAGPLLVSALQNSGLMPPGGMLHAPPLRFSWAAARPVALENLEKWLEQQS